MRRAMCRAAVVVAAVAAPAASAATAQPLPFRDGHSAASTDGRPAPTSVRAAIAAIGVRLYS